MTITSSSANKNDKDNLGYKIGGLTFPSLSHFQFFKDIDKDIRNIVKNLSLREIQELFNTVPAMHIIEEYPDTLEETDCLFPNATQLLIFEGVTRLAKDYATGIFFSKFNQPH